MEQLEVMARLKEEQAALTEIVPSVVDLSTTMTTVGVKDRHVAAAITTLATLNSHLHGAAIAITQAITTRETLDEARLQEEMHKVQVTLLGETGVIPVALLLPTLTLWPEPSEVVMSAPQVLPAPAVLVVLSNHGDVDDAN